MQYGDPVKTLDFNELVREWRMTGLLMGLVAHAAHNGLMDVVVPALILEEVQAPDEHAVFDAGTRLRWVARQRAQLGMPSTPVPTDTGGHPLHLESRFDDQLGFSVPSWPRIGHDPLVAHAIAHAPPVDAGGGGHRNSLIVASVVAVAAAAAPWDVMPVSKDRAPGDEGTSATPLCAGSTGLKRDVELVQDLAGWLLRTPPWRTASVKEALAPARDEVFCGYLSKSDIQEDRALGPGPLGFADVPYAFQAAQTEWSGSTREVSSRHGEEGAVLVHYQLEQTVELDGSFHENARPHRRCQVVIVVGWMTARGRTDWVVRVVVLFGLDQTLDFENLSWRRAAFTPPGLGMEPLVAGLSLFESIRAPVHDDGVGPPSHRPRVRPDQDRLASTTTRSMARLFGVYRDT